MPDIAIVNSTVAGAPKDYVLTGTQELLLKAVEATIDGSSSSAPFQVVLQMIAPNGTVMWSSPTSSVAAGESVVVSWFPDVGDDGGSSGGSSFTVTDGSTTVTGASELDFTSGAVVSSAASGVANVSVGGGMAQLFHQTLTVSAATIDTGVNAIPSTYSSLLIHVSGRRDDAVFSGGFALQFNGDTGNNYDYGWTDQSNTIVTGIVTVAAAGTKVMEGPGASVGANRFGASTVAIPAYANTTTYKSCTSLGGFADGSTHGELIHAISLWRNTAAINQVTLTVGGGGVNMVAGSSMTVWGLV